MTARRGRWQRDAAKERHWRRMLREWRRSGLSVRDFCDWQGLTEPSFYAWRREIAKRDREAGAGRRGSIAGGRRPAATKSAGRAASPEFVPVRVIRDESGAELGTGRALEVRLPSGVQLRVPTGFDRQTLIDVLAALENRPC